MLDTIIAQILATSWIEWLGTTTGVIGVYISIKEKVAAWLFFVLCYASYIYLSLEAGLFAAVLMNSVFIAISVYGWFSWSKSTDVSDTARKVSHVPIPRLLIAGGFVIFGTSVLGWVLSRYTEAYLPYIDGFATCCAFTAQWMLSQKYVENWICWIIADIIYICLWGIQGYYVSVGLFSIFILLAIKGSMEWRAQIRARENA